MTVRGTAEARTVAVSIARPPEVVYAFVHDVRNLPRWSFFTSVQDRGDGRWLVGTPQGEVELRMAERNDLGVVDHHVRLASGEMLVPMRVVPNGDGSEVVFTVFRAPGMADDAFAADVAQVEYDLARLRDVLEGRPVDDG